jgi:hypothetical protein
MDYYNMDGEKISQAEWLTTFENHQARRVGLTTVNDHDISTVLLGIDHSFGYGGPPLIFETMVFCRNHNACDWQDHCLRYSTKERALLGHMTTTNDVKGQKRDQPEGQ